MARVMGYIFDLENPARIETFTPRVPGPVRRLDAFTTPSGALALRWRPPAGGTYINGYCIERTKEGRRYELIGKSTLTAFFIRPDLSEGPWFYRVIAFNLRGVGSQRIVWLFGRSQRGGKILLPIAAIPGLRIQIYE